VSATEGESALTERAQREETQVLTCGLGAQGARARSGIHDLTGQTHGAEREKGTRGETAQWIPLLRAPMPAHRGPASAHLRTSPDFSATAPIFLGHDARPHA
jgi:hypothetical protein